MKHLKSWASILAIVLATALAFGQVVTSTGSFGPHVTPMTADQITDFTKKLAGFTGTAQTYQEFAKPVIPRIQREYPNNTINCSIGWGRDIGRKTLFFFWGRYTDLQKGFDAKLVLKFKDGHEETAYFTSNDSILANAKGSNVVIRFQTTEVIGADVTILLKDGKTMIKQFVPDK